MWLLIQMGLLRPHRETPNPLKGASRRRKTGIIGYMVCWWFGYWLAKGLGVAGLLFGAALFLVWTMILFNTKGGGVG
jgi:hypothetical protein